MKPLAVADPLPARRPPRQPDLRDAGAPAPGASVPGGPALCELPLGQFPWSGTAETERGEDVGASGPVIPRPSVERSGNRRVASLRGPLLGPLLAIPVGGRLVTSPDSQAGKRELPEQLCVTHQSPTLQNVARAKDDLDALRVAVEEGRRKAEDSVARARASEEEAEGAQETLLCLKNFLVGRVGSLMWPMGGGSPRRSSVGSRRRVRRRGGRPTRLSASRVPPRPRSLRTPSTAPRGSASSTYSSCSRPDDGGWALRPGREEPLPRRPRSAPEGP